MKQKKVIRVNIRLVPVVQKLDSAIHRINLYPLDNAIGFPNTYPEEIIETSRFYWNSLLFAKCAQH